MVPTVSVIGLSLAVAEILGKEVSIVEVAFRLGGGTSAYTIRENH